MTIPNIDKYITLFELQEYKYMPKPADANYYVGHIPYSFIMMTAEL